jgi:2-dehydro-3-deoxyglucarate aldolase/4-hydroxy-2-oxoheptanedioate aldolase
MSNSDPFDNPFRRLLGADRVPLGTWLMSGCSSTAEAMGHAGFDWLVVDLEHVPIEYTGALHLLQAIAGTPAHPVVRIAWNDGVLAKRALDVGAQTIMFPFVCTAEDAARAVASTRYAPQGTRGFAAMHRASGYGTKAGYAKRANGAIFCIVQIETLEAVANLEAIACVPGIDGIFLGPGDLSASMGFTGEVSHPSVLDVVADVAARCRKLGTPCGILAPTPDLLSRFVAMGYDFAALSSDMGMMMRQANADIEEVGPSLRKR